MIQKLSNWDKEKFFRDYTQEETRQIIAGILFEYFNFRNIVPGDSQMVYITNFLIEQVRSASAGLYKPCLLRWSFDRFTDSRNNNISAAILHEMIKDGFRSQEYTEILNRWQEEQTNQLPQESVTAKNLEAMAQAWVKCYESVKADNVNLNDWFWVLGYRYLARVLKFVPDEKTQASAQAEAIKLAYADKKREGEEFILAGRSDQARQSVRELEDEAFANGDKVANYRRKLIAVEYLKNNLHSISQQ